jgi:integrase/recombinase XerC
MATGAAPAWLAGGHAGAKHRRSRIITDHPVSLTSARDGWLAALVAAGRSPAYLDLCRVSTTKLISNLAAVGVTDLSGLTRDHCRSWLAALWEAGLAHNTVSTHEANARAWCGWLVRESLLAANPWTGVPRIQPIETVTAVPSPADVQTMIDALLAKEERLDKMKWRALRDVAILSVLLDTGLRAREALRLIRGDIQTDTPILVRGKGKLERRVMLSSHVVRAVLDYVAAYEHHFPMLRPDEQVWRNQAGEPLSYDGLRSAVVAAGRAVGLEIHPHLLRHAFGTFFLDAGGQEESLSVLMGHTKTTTTRRYTRLLAARRALAAQRQFTPAAGLRVRRRSTPGEENV